MGWVVGLLGCCLLLCCCAVAVVISCSLVSLLSDIMIGATFAWGWGSKSPKCSSHPFSISALFSEFASRVSLFGEVISVAQGVALNTSVHVVNIYFGLA
jgi:hypothetical protein